MLCVFDNPLDKPTPRFSANEVSDIREPQIFDFGIYFGTGTFSFSLNIEGKNQRSLSVVSLPVGPYIYGQYDMTHTKRLQKSLYLLEELPRLLFGYAELFRGEER